MSVQNPNDSRGAAADRDGKALQICESLKRKLAELSEGKLRAEQIDSRAHLLDYGYLDSLSAVMFLAHIEERYGVRIDDLEVLEKYYSLDAIVEHLLQSG
jgi:acyl carrier protein